MDLQEFIQHFADQFEDTDAANFTKETQFHNLEEWSSLVGLSIIAMVDEEYGVVLKGNDIRSSKTIGDLFAIVLSKK